MILITITLLLIMSVATNILIFKRWRQLDLYSVELAGIVANAGEEIANLAYNPVFENNTDVQKANLTLKKTCESIEENLKILTKREDLEILKIKKPVVE